MIVDLNFREKNQTKSDFLTQPRDLSFPFAYEEVVNLLGANGYIYILHTQGTFDLNLHSGENQIDLGPTVWLFWSKIFKKPKI